MKWPFVLVLPLLAALGSGLTPPTGEEPVVSDVSFETVDGRTLQLSQETSRHQVLAVVFLSVTCPYSNFFDERLPKISSSYGGKGVGVIAVYANASETVQQIEEHAKSRGFSFPVVRDRDLRLAALLGAVRTPEVFLLDGGRRVRYRGQLASKFGSQSLTNALDDVLAGRQVKVPETKAFGCRIEGR